DISLPVRRADTRYLASTDGNTLQNVLMGQDQLLTPVDWNYGWEPDAGKMPQHLLAECRPLDANTLTALTTSPPYQEYNWPV
ncbi:hypothetical protein ACSTJJ_22975, partial [Vibrio parahaemolyticus]